MSLMNTEMSIDIVITRRRRRYAYLFYVFGNESARERRRRGDLAKNFSYLMLNAAVSPVASSSSCGKERTVVAARRGVVVGLVRRFARVRIYCSSAADLGFSIRGRGER